MSRSVLITGGLGYLGGRIARHLVDEGFSVRVSTRQALDTPPSWCRELEVVQADLADDASLEAACRGVEAVVHLAGKNEFLSRQDPVGALVVNGVGTARALEAAKRAEVSRFVYMSTGLVYRSPLVGEITEATVPRPSEPYATSHRAAEDVVLSAHDHSEIEGAVLRLTNGFGAPTYPQVDRWSLLVNDLCRQAITLGELTLRSSGTQVRDFVTLEDVARAVSLVLGAPGERLDTGVFNLGGESTRSIIEMTELVADRVKQCFGFRPTIRRPDSDPDESPSILHYRIERLKALGFFLVGSPEEEIDKTLHVCADAFGAHGGTYPIIT